MGKLTIATFNIQNRNMKKTMRRNDEVSEIRNFVKEKKIDILSLQEVVEETVLPLSKELEGYQVIGKYRYGKSVFTKFFSLLRKYNEATPIVTNSPVLQVGNYKLPWFPKSFEELRKSIWEYRSITPRILTEAVIQVNGETIRVLNTHLEKRLLGVKSSQLKKIIKVVSKSSYPIVLTGDFNMGLNQTLFQKFVKRLESFHLKRVPIDERTWKNAKKNIAIDHIFIPDTWEILDIQILDNSVSDHYLVLTVCKF